MLSGFVTKRYVTVCCPIVVADVDVPVMVSSSTVTNIPTRRRCGVMYTTEVVVAIPEPGYDGNPSNAP